MSIYRDQLYYDNYSNTLVADATFNSKKYSCVSSASGTQAIANNANTAVAFTSDTLTNWPTRADNTQFVAPVAGTYHVTVQAGYATPPGTTGTNKLLVFKNTALVGEQAFPYTVANKIFNWSGTVSMNGTTDYIQVSLFQESGAPVNAGGNNADGGVYNKITITRVSA